MRYRISPDGGVGAVAQNSVDITYATVWFTLFVGVVFVILGARGKQRWLQFWGALTCVCCAAYFLRDWLGLPPLSALT